MARELDCKEYWRGYHTAQHAYWQGGAAFCELELHKRKETASRSFKSGWKQLLKKRNRDNDYSTEALISGRF